VAFPDDSLQDDNEKGPAFRMVPSMHHRVRSRVEGEELALIWSRRRAAN